ncbi:ribonuclease H-like domain-containing protein [Cristinia sonorae]|uniref:RNA exonuclease 4 n=1 Tax=Cristinia sonorae TaxID=1940300 RepID=A0A8K0XLB9_9AGAR|nr:ribonuclease H-like domain-containing protein [Cristinia sonorae]
MGNKTEVKSVKPSSNWLALQKSLPASSSSKSSSHARKKIKKEHSSSTPVATPQTTVVGEETNFVRGYQPLQPVASTSSAVLTTYSGPSNKNGESVDALRKMVAGELEYSESQKQPGKYLALDCEMVGVGIDGSESSLARVSMVNFYGAVMLDEFVRQRERVVDYRTEFSGIRPSDMVKAKPFAEVQQKVADLIKDRILVGHAIHNDLKVLLLSHPRHLVRDTQVYAGKHKVMKSRRPALRMLVKQELGVAIQEGEHSSVTDARATMAVYRLHRKEWDKGAAPFPSSASSSSSSKKRKAVSPGEVLDDEEDEERHPPNSSTRNTGSGKKREKDHQAFPGGGRKGISSGLSTIIKRRDGRDNVGDGGAGKRVEKKVKTEWWKELGGTSGPKGSMSFRTG